MVVELRDKLASMELPAAAGSSGQNVSKTADAILALVSLGYKQNEAAKMATFAAAGGGDGVSVEEIVRRALKR